MNYFKTQYNKYFVIDSFFLETNIIQILMECFTKPKRVFYLEASKDQIEENIQKFSPDKEEKQ